MFEETRDGDQGKFAETLRDQHLYDVMSTYPAIEDAIRRAVHVEKGGADAVLAAGKRFNAATDDTVAVETTVAVIRKGLAAYDRGIPESMLNKILATGLALPLADAPFSDYRTVQVEDFVQRLRTIVIARFSKAKAETEAQIEEKFMRSLPEEEKKVTLCPPILEDTHAQPFRRERCASPLQAGAYRRSSAASTRWTQTLAARSTKKSWRRCCVARTA